MENNYYLAREMIKRHEGLRLKPYKCTAGKLTIGYGRNLDDKGISENEAHMMLLNDIADAIDDLKTIFRKEWHTIPSRKQSALIDMVFNLGRGKFLQFKKMIAAIEKSDWQEAGEQAKDSDWYKQVGHRGPEIVSILKEG